MTILGREFTAADARRVVWTAIAAAIAVVPTALTLMKSDPKAALLSVITVAGAAAGSAIKNWFLADTSPIK